MTARRRKPMPIGLIRTRDRWIRAELSAAQARYNRTKAPADYCRMLACYAMRNRLEERYVEADAILRKIRAIRLENARRWVEEVAAFEHAAPIRRRGSDGGVTGEFLA